MSGGLDSTAVAALARESLQNCGSFDLRAYTAVFHRLIPDAERHFSRVMAAALNIPIHHLIGDGYGLFQDVADHPRPWPEPANNPLDSIWNDLVKQASIHSRVVLSGDGGDPILHFVGLYVFKMLKELHLLRLGIELGGCFMRHGRLPKMGLRTTLKSWLRRQAPSNFPAWINPSFSASLNLPARWQQFFQKPFSFTVLRGEAYPILQNGYWASLFEKYYNQEWNGAQVEFRHPFFDLRLLTYALALPPLPWCTDKLVLREAGDGLLPEEIRRRPKSPMVACPVAELLRQPRTAWINRVQLAPGMDRYIDKDAFFPLTPEGNSFSLEQKLRALSLNFWLSQMAAASA
jgi:asparagine synthase (glutamine-hydrolysing)